MAELSDDDFLFQLNCIERVSSVARNQPLLPLRFLIERVLETFTEAERARADRLAGLEQRGSFREQLEQTLRASGAR